MCTTLPAQQELPLSGVSVERELDDMVPVLLKKAGDLSTAGATSTNVLLMASTSAWAWCEYTVLGV